MLATEKGRALARGMPRERVLTESDGPFAQVNGTSAMPWDVALAVEELGIVWSLSAEVVEHTIHSNLKTLLAAQSL